MAAGLLAALLGGDVDLGGSGGREASGDLRAVVEGDRHESPDVAGEVAGFGERAVGARGADLQNVGLLAHEVRGVELVADDAGGVGDLVERDGSNRLRRGRVHRHDAVQEDAHEATLARGHDGDVLDEYSQGFELGCEGFDDRSFRACHRTSWSCRHAPERGCEMREHSARARPPYRT